jgi:hypothetical protein
MNEMPIDITKDDTEICQVDQITGEDENMTSKKEFDIDKLEIYIKQRLECEKQMLIGMWGKAWSVMARCPEGSGYEACEDILDEISRMKA